MSDVDGPEIDRSVLESLQTRVYICRDRTNFFWSQGAEKITSYLRTNVVGAFCCDQPIAADARTRNVLSAAADAISATPTVVKPDAAWPLSRRPDPSSQTK